MEDLRPCPFCGENPRVIENSGDLREMSSYRCLCTGCGMMMPAFHNRESAKLAWNYRQANQENQNG